MTYQQADAMLTGRCRNRTGRSVLGPQNRTNYRHDKFLTAANIANKGDDSDSTIQADSN